MRLGAGFDPAVSLNACALVVVGEVRPLLWRVLAARAWQGTARTPLDIRLNVGPEAAAIVLAHGLTSWMSDAYEFAAVRNVSREERFGLRVHLDEAPLEESFGAVRRMMNRTLLGQSGPQLSLRADDPDLDLLCAQMATELAGVTFKRRAGHLQILMPHGEDGSHGDLGRALVRALWHAKACREKGANDDKAGLGSEQFRSARGYGADASRGRGEHEDSDPYEELFRHPRAR